MALGCVRYPLPRLTKRYTQDHASPPTQTPANFDPGRPTVKTTTKWVAPDTTDFIGTTSSGKGLIMSGDGPGVSPMQMLLLGLGGCASVDVVSIMKKQRQPLADLRVEVEGQRSKEGARPWETIEMKFIGKGKVDPEKFKKAVELSTEKYCGVHATLSKSATIYISTFVEDM